MDKKSWKYLVLKCQHPTSGKTYYFVDKCMPFGASISCAIFQEFSNSVAYIVQFKTGHPLVNYLDDYFFAAFKKSWCDSQIDEFLKVCNDISFPVSLEKTVWGSKLLVFLGLLIDTVQELVGIPMDKLHKALDMIEFFLNKRNQKATVHQIQRLAGFLNFLCKCIIPGRAFFRRLYSLIISEKKLLPHHHFRITEEVRLDLKIWKVFLEQPDIFYRPFLDCVERWAHDIDMYSDASGSVSKGAGAYCGTSWTFCQWDRQWMIQAKPSIEYLELFGVTMGVLLWIKRFRNSSIKLHCDNESVCKMINKSSTSCKNSMVLIRILVLECLRQNVFLTAEWVATSDNGKADALSRLQFERFRRLAKGKMDMWPEKLPEEIWPINKIWIK